MSLENILSQETVQKLGWTLLHFIWQATAVALLLAIVLAAMRRTTANIRYTIACLALGLMVLLPIVTITLVPVSAPQPMVNTEPPPAPVLVPMQPAAAATPLARAVEHEEPVRLENADTTPTVPWRYRAAAVLEPALPHLVSGWLIGVFGLSVWHLGGWAQLQRLRRKLTRPVDISLHAALKQLADRVGVRRAVELLESALVQVPTVVGWLRPAILLPAVALTGLAPEQLEALLAHELAHVRRCDYLVNMVQTVIETLGFCHPAVWWVSHKIRIERENCCDDLAVSITGDRLRYARALTSMEEIRTGRAELAVAASGGNLSARIHRLVGKDSTDSSRASWIPSVITILLIAVIAVPTTVALTTRWESREPRQETEVPIESKEFDSVESKESSGTQAAQVRCVGKVIDSRDQLIAGAKVAAYEMHFDGIAGNFMLRQAGEMTTAEDGAFTFRTDPKPERSLFHQCYIIALRQDLALGWTTWKMREDAESNIELGEPAKLEGTIVDDAGQPIAGAEVRANLYKTEETAEGEQIKEWLPGIAPLDGLGTRTNSQGRFFFGNLPAGLGADLLVTAAGKAMTYTQRSDGQEPAFRTGQTEIRVVVPVEARIEGRLLRPDTGKGVARTKFAVVADFSGLFYYRFVHTTDDDGRFNIGGLQTGRYVIRDGRFPVTYVDVKAGKTTKLTVERTSKSYYFHVFMEHGSPEVINPERRITVRFEDNEGVQDVGYIDVDGYFKVYLSQREFRQWQSGKGWFAALVPNAGGRSFRREEIFSYYDLTKDRPRTGGARTAGFEKKADAMIANAVPSENDITELDVPQAGQTVTQIFEIRYGDPSEMVKSLKKVLSIETDPRSATSAKTGPSGQPVVLIAEPRRNWIIAKASAEDIKQVRKWIEELDRPDAASSGLETRRDDFEVFRPRMIKLQNSDPLQMVKLLTALFAEEGGEGVNIRDVILGEDAEGKRNIVGPLSSHFTFQDVPGTNSIIVISNIPKAYDVVVRLILELDKQKMATKDVKQVREWIASLVREGRLRAPKNQATISGRCLDAGGQPLSNAQVQVYCRGSEESRVTRVAEGRTDSEGRFRLGPLALPSEEDWGRKSYFVLVPADGHGPAWKAVNLYEETIEPLELAASNSAVVTGSVVTEDSKPVAGAQVWVRGIIPPEATEDPASRSNALFTHAPLPGWSATTGNDGSFRIAGVPDGTRIQLRISHRDFAGCIVHVKAGGHAKIEVQPAAVITGRVLYGDTGKPAGGVKVQAQGVDSVAIPGGWMATGSWTVTDNEGRYRLESLPGAKYNIGAEAENLTVVALDSFQAQVGEVREAPDLLLIEGGFIAGRVIDETTGKPVRPGQHSHVSIYGPSRPKSGAAVQSSRIREDGSFAIRVAPGSNYVYLQPTEDWGRGRTFTSLRSPWVDVADGQTVEVEFGVRKLSQEELGKQAVFWQSLSSHVPETLDELENSADRLRQLGIAISMYAREHGDTLPDGLQQLEEYVQDKEQSRWLLENVEYLGKGKGGQPNAARVPVAYDRTLLQQNYRTQVLFLDFSVRFLEPEQLSELRIGKASEGINMPPSDAGVYEQSETMVVDLSALRPTMSFSDALGVISRSVAPPLDIRVNWTDLRKAAGIDGDTKIGMEGASAVLLGEGLESLLKAVAGGSAELNYIVDNGAITIATLATLPPKLLPRVYDISDLVTTAAEADALTRRITETIEPQSWHRPGRRGGGTIAAYPVQVPKKFAILQSRKIHKEIERLLEDARCAKAEQEKAKSQVLIETRTLTVSDEFLRHVGLDPNTLEGPGWANPLAPTSGESFAFMLDNPNVDLLLEAVETRKDYRLLGPPKFVAIEGKQAQIAVVSQTQFLEGVFEPNGPSQAPKPEPEKLLFGTSVKLTPELTPDGKNIALDLDIEVRRFTSCEERQYDQNYAYQLPGVTIRSSKMRVVVSDRGTLPIVGRRIAQAVLLTQQEASHQEALWGNQSALPTAVFRQSPTIETPGRLLILVKPTIEPEKQAEELRNSGRREGE